MINILILILIFSPLLMSLLIMSPFIQNQEHIIRKTSKSFAIVHMILTSILLMLFDFSSTNYAIETNYSWIKSLGFNFSFYIDSLTILFVTLTSIIFLISIFISKKIINKSHRLYYSLIFILQSAILGVFCAKDIFLFFLFWELELIPMYLLILKWGSGNKEKTATKFILYTFFGSIFMLFAFLSMYFYNYLLNGELTADITQLNLQLAPFELKIILFTLLAIGFGVKLPIFPLHSWLPDAHSQAPTPASIILSSILLKMGAYGLLRFNIEMFSDVFEKIAIFVMLFGVINLIYASICAIAQKDLKRIIAFSGIAHMGIFLIGISSLNETGTTGAIFQLFSHALISAGLFSIAGIIYIKCGTKNILRLQGLAEKMPRLMLLSTPIILAALGVPLLSGFIADFLSFTGAFLFDADCCISAKALTTLALFSIVICSVYILKFFHGIFYGETMEKFKKISDINIQHTAILGVIAIYIILLGVYPSILTDIISKYSIITYNIVGVY